MKLACVDKLVGQSVSSLFVSFFYFCCYFVSYSFTMPPRKLRTPFKAPRQATKKGTTNPGVGHRKDNAEWGKRMERELGQIEKRQKSVETNLDSDDDEDNVPFSALKSITKADKPQPIEYVGEVWKEKVSPFVLITETEEEVCQTGRRAGYAKMLSEREADETAKFGEVLSTRMGIARI